MSRADIPEEMVEVWPDVWPAFELFEALTTQWRIGGMGVATGLDYASIPAAAAMLGIKRRNLMEIFPDLRIMEHEALGVMAEAME
ncbi:DUF1799 domain-containing protein [Pseudomonas guariconensis]|nr:DUF1799 domain-containing protein [Pseudomonas guariconensis]MBF8732801.1 DUF1799 domain-containing protein [Pseudomonas guariconensis]